MPRLTEAEADDLARQALIAMALDEYRRDLRIKVKRLRPSSVPTGPSSEAQADGWDEAIDAVLDLFNEDLRSE